MSLPPVVSDSERCRNRERLLPPSYGPHAWVNDEKVWETCSHCATGYWRKVPTFEVCRYCGGRRP